MNNQGKTLSGPQPQESIGNNLIPRTSYSMQTPEQDLVMDTDMDMEMEESAPMGFKGSNKIRDVSIKELDRGFVVSIGCHTFAITKVDELTNLISKYLNNPHEVEKEWFDGKLLTR